MVDCFLKYAMINFNYYCLRLQNEGNIMKNWTDILKNLTILTQFSLSFITPLLLCLALSWWLTEKFQIGPWIYIPGFFFGLGGSAMVAYKLYLSVSSHQKKERKEKKQHISFNRHH